jgi:hypothetical protein
MNNKKDFTSDDMMTDDMDWRAESSLYFFNKS